MKKLAVLGGSYLQLPLVQKAEQKGIEVHCFAWDDGRAVCKQYASHFYPISVLEKDQIFEICKEIEIDGITTIATDICIPVIAAISSELNLKGNSINTAYLTTDKGKMRKLLLDNMLNSPHSKVFSNSFSDLELENLSEKFKFPLIVKPLDRSGSIGVTIVENVSELRSALISALDFSINKQAIVEEFIDGQEISVETISFNGRHKILAVTDKVITTPPHFVELAHHQPSKLSDNILRNVENDTLKILNAAGIQNGASHLEFKINNKSEIYLIEIGSRMGGDFIGSDLVELSTGIDFVSAVIDIALGQFNWEQVDEKFKKYSGIYFLSKETESLLPYFEDELDWIVKKEILNPELSWARSSNDRAGYLIYQSDQKINI